MKVINPYKTKEEYLAARWRALSLSPADLKEGAENVNKVLESSDDDMVSDLISGVMCDLLTDENWTTAKMFEGLASDYVDADASDDFRRGIDIACSALTGWYFKTIALQILEEINAKKEAV